MNRPRLVASTLGVAAGLALPVAVPTVASAAPVVSMSGSTSIAPLARSLAKRYASDNPGKLEFRLLQGGSDIGVTDVSRGRVSIGNASRDPLPNDPDGLNFNKIARDGVCVITSPDNPLSNLSQAQVQSIFSGRTRNWSEVPGARSTGSINLVTRTAASGTADAFSSIFMGPSLRVAASASQKSSNGLVAQTVRSDDNAIGYVSFERTAGVSPAGYQGVPCTLRNAKSGQYAGVRNFWMVTRGVPAGGAKTFIRWIKSSSQARKIINTKWIALN